MIEVVSTYPEHYQDGVPIDIAIKIKFNKEIKDAYLTSAYFRIFVLPNYQGQITAQITKDPADSTQVLLTPSLDLPELGQFEVWVAGDMDITDATEQGIQSVDDEAMDKNYTFRFSAGTERQVDVILDDGDVSDGTDTTPGVTLGVLSTSPSNNAFGVLCSGQADADIGVIDITFDSPILIQGDSALAALRFVTQPLDDIDTYVDIDEAHGIVHDSDDFQVGYHPDHIEEKDVVRIALKTPFRCNSDISVTMSPGFAVVSGDPNAGTLSSDYTFEFRTTLYPMLSTARAVKSRLSHSIQNLSDKIIDEYILTTTLDVIYIYFGGRITDAMFKNRWVKQLVTCLVAKNLVNSVLGNHVGTVIKRTLGDLSITYDTSALREIMGSVEDCIGAAESHLDKARITHGAKSSTTNEYPGRRRVLFPETNALLTEDS